MTLTVSVVIISGPGSLTTTANAAHWGTYMQRALASIPQRGAALGSPAAEVTVTEYADLQCPYCEAYTLSLLPRLVTEYVKPGKVRMVFRTVAVLGPDSLRAARAAAAAAAQNRLWNFADVFYLRQQVENSGYVTGGFLRRVAADAGLNVKRFMAEQAAPATLATVRAQAALARAAGVTATPTFVIERAELRGSTRVVGYAQLAEAIGKLVDWRGAGHGHA